VRTTIAASGHVVDVIAHELTDRETAELTAALAAAGIRVAPVTDIYHVLHLWALQPTTTAQEVAVLAAFGKVTDCRLAWHKAGA
jgi:hypothetical protein